MTQTTPKRPDSLTHVKHIIAIASGKGGVGKSTVSANIAAALQKKGLAVGILDADIQGPNQPILLGIKNEEPEIKENYFIPVEAYGIKVLSMGLLVQADLALAWRSIMVIRAFRQFIENAHWGSLDVLIIDMPPGTGDIPLSLAQNVPLDGAVIVSTPQDLSLSDVTRSIDLFKKVNTPILGVIENMSTFICPNCQHETPIFSHHKVHSISERMKCPFLGDIPLHLDVQNASNQGRPVVLSHPDSSSAKAINKITDILHEKLL